MRRCAGINAEIAMVTSAAGMKPRMKLRRRARWLVKASLAARLIRGGEPHLKLRRNFGFLLAAAPQQA
jgi:hypothetical protein